MRWEKLSDQITIVRKRVIRDFPGDMLARTLLLAIALRLRTQCLHSGDTEFKGQTPRYPEQGMQYPAFPTRTVRKRREK